ncbi:MAG: dethiobiotin synthase [Candidatus Melainabacteria bacterium]|nr:dethiobiotin synthase [Candidatus Melainabacteria bacterium]
MHPAADEALLPQKTSAAGGLFVTGTDTDVGKTVVTSLLAALALAKGRNVCVYKPVQTGVSSPAESDPALAQQWLGAPLATHCSYCFGPAVTPQVADPEQTIALPHLQADLQDLRQRYDCLVVEGAGGVMVPVAPGLLMRDVMLAFALPVVVVTRPNLGTINHTLLTVQALQAAGLCVLGVVVSIPQAALDPKRSCDPAVASLPSMFAQWLPVPVLAWLTPLALAPSALSPGRLNLDQYEALAAIL